MRMRALEDQVGRLLERERFLPQQVGFIVRRELEQHEGRSWTQRERWLGIGGLAMIAGSLAVSIVSLTGGAG